MEVLAKCFATDLYQLYFYDTKGRRKIRTC